MLALAKVICVYIMAVIYIPQVLAQDLRSLSDINSTCRMASIYQLDVEPHQVDSEQGQVLLLPRGLRFRATITGVVTSRGEPGNRLYVLNDGYWWRYDGRNLGGEAIYTMVGDDATGRDRMHVDVRGSF